MEKEGGMGETPKLGDIAYNFNLPDSKGKNNLLEDMLGNGDVMLVFFRGLW